MNRNTRLVARQLARRRLLFRNTAHVYDLIYEGAGKDYAAEADVLRELVLQRKAHSRSLLDVACGTGGHLLHLRQWFDVAGLDIEPGMLAEARRKLPDVPLVRADMRSFELHRRFDAVVCLFSSIGYMRSTLELQAAVERMGAHLAPGGVLIVDGWIRPDRWIEPGTVHADAGCRPGIAAARVGRTRREGNKSFLEIYHLIGTLDDVEYVVDHHELTLFEPIEYEDAFTRAGLDVEVVPSPLAGRDRYVATRPHRG
jgi:SAM-dependent methyltransferase